MTHVQPCYEKYSTFFFSEVKHYWPRPASREGRIAIVTTREAEMRWPRWVAQDGRTLMRTAKSCGPGLPVLRPCRNAFAHCARGQ